MAIAISAPEKAATPKSKPAPEKKKAKSPEAAPLVDKQLERVAKKREVSAAEKDAEKAAKIAAREEQRRRDRMTAAAIQAVATMLDDIFIGDRLIEGADVTKDGALLRLNDGNKVSITIKQIETKPAPAGK